MSIKPAAAHLADLWVKFELIALDRNAASQPHFDAAKALVHEMHQADEANDCFRCAGQTLNTSRMAKPIISVDADGVLLYYSTAYAKAW